MKCYFSVLLIVFPVFITKSLEYYLGVVVDGSGVPSDLCLEVSCLLVFGAVC